MHTYANKIKGLNDNRDAAYLDLIREEEVRPLVLGVVVVNIKHVSIDPT